MQLLNIVTKGKATQSLFLFILFIIAIFSFTAKIKGATVCDIVHCAQELGIDGRMILKCSLEKWVGDID